MKPPMTEHNRNDAYSLAIGGGIVVLLLAIALDHELSAGGMFAFAVFGGAVCALIHLLAHAEKSKR